MNVLFGAGVFAVLLFVWRGLRRLVLILGIAFLVGYLRHQLVALPAPRRRQLELVADGGDPVSARAWVLLALVVAWWSQAGQSLDLLGASGSRVGSDVPHAAEFNRAGSAHGVDPALLAAVARVESDYRVDAVSPAGAQGLMQFMPVHRPVHGGRPVEPGRRHRWRRPLPGQLPPHPRQLARGHRRLQRRRPSRRQPRNRSRRTGLRRRRHGPVAPARQPDHLTLIPKGAHPTTYPSP